jgi:hypothetical protein
MTALAKDRNTPARAGDLLVLPVAANAKIFAGALVAMGAAGYAVPGNAASGLLVAGRAEENVDNTGGADGAATVKVSRGIFKYANDSASPVAATDLLKDCYILDDQTVSILGTNRSKAGKVLGVEPDGVWVDTRF